MMEKAKIVLVSFLAIITIGVIFFNVNNNETTNNDTKVITVSFSELESKINNKDDFVLVISQDGCSHCKNYSPIIDRVSSKYDIEIYNLNLTKLISEDAKKLNNIANINATPTTIFFKNGEEVSTLNRINGEASEKKLVEKLKKLGYIGD